MRFAQRWRVLLIAMAGFAGAVGVNGLLHAVSDAQTRVIPSVAAIAWAVAGFGIAALLASCVAALRRSVGGLAKLGVLTLHLFVAAAGGAAVLATDPAFLFGPHYVDDLAVPGGGGRIYLYRGGLFCSQTLWRSLPGEWLAHHDPELGSYSCKTTAELRWDETHGRPEVVDALGRPLGSPAHDALFERAFDWGPH
jgi:hypothetical protein